MQQQAKRKVKLKLLLLPKKLDGVQLALVLLLPLLAYGDVCQLEGVEGGHLEGQGEQKRRQWQGLGPHADQTPEMVCILHKRSCFPYI